MNSEQLNVEIVRGVAADALLADESFRVEWSALCEQCPWSTAFQAPGFARCWYTVYRKGYEPLLVLSRDASGRLQGFLPLALSAGGEALVHTGAHQAEYQTWISRPELGDAFIQAAIRRLRREVAGASLDFRYLPKNAPLGWLNDPAARRTCLLRKYPRPLMIFGDGKDVAESLSKRGNKGRLRRMERLGRVEFLRVTDPDRLEAMMDDVSLFYDARRLAVNGAVPFASDPLKRAFHLAMARVPGLLHTTALLSGSRLASFHFNTRERKHLQLSLIGHNPFLAEFSPGKFHVLLLAKMLMAEGGCDWIDLTPGGDPYKERFANAWDHVYTLTVFSTPTEKRKAAIYESIQDGTKRALTRWNIRPAQARAIASKYARLGPIGLPATLAKQAMARLGRPKVACVYSLNLKNAARVGAAQADESGGRIRRDAIDDLMAYQPVHGGPTPQEFLSDAFRRIEEGQRPYTCAEGGRLSHYAWFAPAPAKERFATSLPGVEVPGNSALVVDCYTFPHARRRGLGTASLAAILHDASEMKDLAQAFIAVPSTSEHARRIVERAGFAYERSCLRRFNSM